MTPEDGGIAKGAGIMAAARGWRWLHAYINERCERTAARMRIARTLDCSFEEATRLEAMARVAANMNTMSSEEVFETIIRAWEKQGEKYVDQ